MDLNGLGIQLEAFFLVREELLNILALIALKLDHLSHLSINHDGAIASELLLNDLQNLLLVELLGETLDSGQSLTTISLCDRKDRVSKPLFPAMPGVDGATAAVPPRESGRALTLDTNVDVILGLLCLSSIFVGFGEGVEGLEIFD